MKVLSILKKIALFTLIVGLLPFNYVYADAPQRLSKKFIINMWN